MEAVEIPAGGQQPPAQRGWGFKASRLTPAYRAALAATSRRGAAAADPPAPRLPPPASQAAGPEGVAATAKPHVELTALRPVAGTAMLRRPWRPRATRRTITADITAKIVFSAVIVPVPSQIIHFSGQVLASTERGAKAVSRVYCSCQCIPAPLLQECQSCNDRTITVQKKGLYDNVDLIPVQSWI